jgi:hypothetical protein
MWNSSSDVPGLTPEWARLGYLNEHAVGFKQGSDRKRWEIIGSAALVVIDVAAVMTCPQIPLHG